MWLGEMLGEGCHELRLEGPASQAVVVELIGWILVAVLEKVMKGDLRLRSQAAIVLLRSQPLSKRNDLGRTGAYSRLQVGKSRMRNEDSFAVGIHSLSHELFGEGDKPFGEFKMTGRESPETECSSGVDARYVVFVEGER